MELWLVVVEPGGVEREVAVEADPTDTAADLLRALGWPEDLAVVPRRTREPLVPSEPLEGQGLRHGDVLELGAAPSQAVRPPGRLRLVVAGGPAVGRVVDLPPGETVVGRSSGVDVVLDDRTLSRRHLRLTVDGDRVVVEDAGSTYGTFLFGQRLSGPVDLPYGALLEAGETVLRVERSEQDAAPSPARQGRLQFSRPPRISPPRPPTVHEVAAPPDVVPKRRIPLASSLIPLMAVPIMALSGVPAQSYLIMAALSPAMVVASYAEDRRNGGKDRKEKLATFRAEVAATEALLQQGLRDEGVRRWAAHPDPPEVLRRALGTSSRLWERRPSDPDFLALRVGWADQPSTTSWRLRDGGDPAARAEAEEQLKAHAEVPAAPLVVPLDTTCVAGLCGTVEETDETGRWLVAQAAVLHSPRDLVLAVAVTEPRATAWEWTAWLPHTRADVVPYAAPGLAVGEDQARSLLAALQQLVTLRREAAEGRLQAGSVALPAVLLVLDGALEVPRTAVAELLEQGPGVGLRVVWLGDRVADLPGETGSILEREGGKVALTHVQSGAASGPSSVDTLSLAATVSLARALAGVEDATAQTRSRAELPSLAPLPEVLGGAPTAESVARTWQQHRQGLGAPVAVGAEGPFVLDLREHGPHALLGGTTGAGKSELLQSFVASLAASVPPTRVSFLLVDYKGGAAFKDCVALPHVAGFVTDLDGHLVSRVLTSLNAELHRRERVLASVGAKDLLEMERKAPGQAPPALVLVVDEFATLAKELPEFVDGVVNVAQRGRSLGIHMLLATQRPAGAINDNIRANTNLRMALRMNDEPDSEDVLKSPLAARLPEKPQGRAYVRIGTALTQVQVAYAGGHTLAGGDRRPLVVHPWHRGVVQRSDAQGPEEEVEDDRPTDLQQVVGAVRAAAEVLGLPAPPRPWLAPLPDLISLEELPRPAGAAVAVLGRADLPARQEQRPYVVDLEEEGSLLVYGTSGSGKTTLLRTLAVSLAQQSPPEALHLYALDFATRGLSSLGSLPHCGAVISGDDVERVQRLFTLLERDVARRKARFAQVGATSLADFVRITGDAAELPRTVVLLDSYAGFTSVFDTIDYGARIEAMPHLVSQGRPLGIHFVMTADRRQAVPLALSSSVPAKVVLRLADPDDYAVLGLDGRVARSATLPPGRGFDGDTREVQCAVVGSSAAGDAQLLAVAAVGRALQDRFGGGTAPAVETLPSSVDLAAVLPAAGPLRPVLGLGEADLAPVGVDPADGHFLVAGPNRSGKSTALAALARSLRAAMPDLQMHLLAPRRTALSELDVWTGTARGGEEVEQLCSGLLEELGDRDEASPLVVLVLDDGHELGDSSMASDALERLARRGRDAAVWLVGACETGAAHRSYGGWVMEVKKDRQGLLLQADADVDGDLLGARLTGSARNRTSIPGRGVLVTRSGVQVVQVAGA